tara:strand:- start:69 stop:563 length:495 start_codon:yes stop_codon:yes gene_type:complete
MAGFILMIYTRANKMKKILLTILAGIGGVSALLADGGRPVVITKTTHGESPITLGNSVCVSDEIWETREFHEAWAKLRELEPNFYGGAPIGTRETGRVWDLCSHVANWKEGYVKPDFVSDDARICTRIEGCEINPKAETEEEYCPTCVWKSEVKKVKTTTKELI